MKPPSRRSATEWSRWQPCWFWSRSSEQISKIAPLGSDLAVRHRGPLRGALEEIRGHVKAGYQAVYDADLKGYFDSIPRDKLLACVRMRVVDRSVLKLIRMWLESPVVEPESGGKPER